MDDEKNKGRKEVSKHYICQVRICALSKNYFLEEDRNDCRVSYGPHENSVFYIYIHNYF